MPTLLRFMVALAIYAVLPGGSQGWVGGLGNQVLPGGSLGSPGGLGNQGVLPGGNLGWREGLGNPGVFPGGSQGWVGGLGNQGVIPGGSGGWVGGLGNRGVFPGGSQVLPGGVGSYGSQKEGCKQMILDGRRAGLDLPSYCLGYITSGPYTNSGPYGLRTNPGSWANVKKTL